MGAAEPLGDQEVEGLADHLEGLPAEHPAGGGIEQADAAVAVDHQDAVVGQQHQLPQQLAAVVAQEVVDGNPVLGPGHRRPLET